MNQKGINKYLLNLILLKCNSFYIKMRQLPQKILSLFCSPPSPENQQKPAIIGPLISNLSFPFTRSPFEQFIIAYADLLNLSQNQHDDYKETIEVHFIPQKHLAVPVNVAQSDRLQQESALDRSLPKPACFMPLRK